MTIDHPFAGRRTRVLGMSEVRGLIDMRAAIDVQRSAFLSLARGTTAAAPNSWLRLPGERRGWLKLLAGYDGTEGGLGVKILARFPENPPGANLGSLLLLFDPDNGFPLAIMDGVYVTALRTGAGAGLATEALARPDGARIGLVGTGVVAWYSLLAMTTMRSSWEDLRVYSRSETRRIQFCERASSELGLRSAPVASIEEAVAGADVIVTATNSPEPVLLAQHVRPGVHINAMGIRTEIAPDVTAQCLVVGDGRDETLHDGKFSVALASGAVAEDDLGPDLGALLDGAELPGDAGRVTMFDSSGVAIQDVTVARYVWERAEAQQVGVLVDLGLEGAP
ncbi:MAG: ornithine cyclodeaminase family protein [Actinomycetota bacterium]